MTKFSNQVHPFHRAERRIPWKLACISKATGKRPVPNPHSRKMSANEARRVVSSRRWEPNDRLYPGFAFRRVSFLGPGGLLPTDARRRLAVGVEFSSRET